MSTETESRLRYYLLVMTVGLEKDLDSLIELVPDFPFWDANQQARSNTDCLLFSIKSEQYSFNRSSIVAKAPIDIHVCGSIEEFIAYVCAYQLGSDLSGLWSNKDGFI